MSTTKWNSFSFRSARAILLLCAPARVLAPAFAVTLWLRLWSGSLAKCMYARLVRTRASTVSCQYQAQNRTHSGTRKHLLNAFMSALRQNMYCYVLCRKRRIHSYPPNGVEREHKHHYFIRSTNDDGQCSEQHDVPRASQSHPWMREECSIDGSTTCLN